MCPSALKARAARLSFTNLINFTENQLEGGSMSQSKTSKLEKKAGEIRRQTLNMCIEAGTGHVTSSFSCAEILVALYYGGIINYDAANPKWQERDRFILSKGQASPILYVILAD